MPIYEFKCRKCGANLEHLVRNEDQIKDLACPKCGGKSLERQFSTFAAHAAPAATPLTRGPCGRCGDPNGPCSA